MLATTDAGSIVDHALLLGIAIATIFNSLISRQTKKAVNGVLAKNTAATKTAVDKATGVAMDVSDERARAANVAGQVTGRLDEKADRERDK